MKKDDTMAWPGHRLAGASRGHHHLTAGSLPPGHPKNPRYNEAPQSRRRTARSPPQADQPRGPPRAIIKIPESRSTDGATPEGPQSLTTRAVSHPDSETHPRAPQASPGRPNQTPPPVHAATHSARRSAHAKIPTPCVQPSPHRSAHAAPPTKAPG
jgi:hypothetical protein